MNPTGLDFILSSPVNFSDLPNNL